MERISHCALNFSCAEFKCILRRFPKNAAMVRDDAIRTVRGRLAIRRPFINNISDIARRIRAKRECVEKDG